MTFLQGSSLFFQLFFTGAEKESIFWNKGEKSIGHPFLHLLDASWNTHWTNQIGQKKTRLVAETFYFVVDCSAIYVASEVSLSRAIFEG